MCSIINLSMMAVLTLGVLVFVSCGPVGNADNYRSLQHNMKIFKTWKCGEPKPVLVYVEDEMLKSGNHKSGSTYRPEAVVVNRCAREFGCCSGGQTCQADTEEPMIFEVRVYAPDASGYDNLKLPLDNHVKCKCKSPDTQI